VVLKNGDRVTGTAVKLEGGKLIFKTAYADVVTIAWDQIASLTLSQPLILVTPKEKLNVISIERTSSGLAVGTHSVTAVYGGDASFLNSSSTAFSQVVSKDATTTSVS